MTYYILRETASINKLKANRDVVLTRKSIYYKY